MKGRGGSEVEGGSAVLGKETYEIEESSGGLTDDGGGLDED